MKVLHLESNRYSEDSLEKLAKHVQLTCLQVSDQEELFNHLKENQYDAIFIRLGLTIDRNLLALQSELRIIVTPTTGLNHIDLKKIEERGIKIISLKGEYKFLSKVKSTAEHTWMLLLNIIRNFVPAQESVKKGNWDRGSYLADELNTKTIGIIGLGRLGKILVGYAKAFSMDILCNDIDPSVFTEEYCPYQSDLDNLLERADYVILQIDFRPENEKFFGADKFSKMKQGAYFINTSRGELVDEHFLMKALQEGHLKGAAIDVLDGDSSWDCNTSDCALITYAKQCNNLIITPHMGGYGKISIEMTRTFVTDKFLNFDFKRK